MKYTTIGLIFILIFSSCERNKIENKSNEYFQLALDTMNFRTNSQDNYDSIYHSRLLTATILLDSCIKTDSSMISAYFWQSFFRVQLGDTLSALKSTSKGIEKCSDDNKKKLVELYVQRGAINLKVNKKDSYNDLEKALTIYDKILKKEPSNLDAIMNKSIVLCFMDEKDNALLYLKSIKNKKLESEINDLIIQTNNFDLKDFMNNK